MQEQEENRQPDHIAACRGQFLSALSNLNVGMTPLADAADVEPEPVPVVVPVPQPVKLVVFFDFDKADLDSAAREKLSATAFR